MQEHLIEHFNSEGHNGLLLDASVLLIDKTDAKIPIKQEHYCQHTLKMLASYGLNVGDVDRCYCDFGYCKCNIIIVVVAVAVVIVLYDE